MSGDGFKVKPANVGNPLENHFLKQGKLKQVMAGRKKVWNITVPFIPGYL